jgi:hypothetical protein
VPPSAFRLAADAIVLFHAAFVLFVLLGGLLVLRWRWMAWVHLPAAVWGVLVEYAGWICPLTPLEDDLRHRAGDAVYSGDFIGRCLLPLLYPATLTRAMQVLLGSLALLVNVIVYWRLIRRVVSDERRRK